MKNFRLLAVLVIASAGVAPAAHAGPTLLSTETLYKACMSKPDTKEHALCLGFIAGVASAALPATRAAYLALGGKGEADAMLAAKASGLVFGCGENSTIADTIKDFNEYVTNHPNKKLDAAVTTLTQMMSEKYKCTK